jgi:hypothetical protein
MSATSAPHPIPHFQSCRICKRVLRSTHERTGIARPVCWWCRQAVDLAAEAAGEVRLSVGHGEPLRP